MEATDATYVKSLTAYIKGLAPKQQCEFVVLASKYLYIRDQGDVLPPLAELDTPFLKGKYRTRVVNQTVDGIVKEVSIKDALNILMSVCTDEKREGMVDRKISALSAKAPRPTVKEFQGIFTAAPAAFNTWNPFNTSVFSTNTKPFAAPAAPAAPAAKAVPAPTSPNLFPGASLSSLHNLAALNRFIEERYAGKMGDEARYTVSAGRTIGSYMTNFKEYTFSDYECMHSEGSNSDCLIHSFLTATCPAFRRLTSGFVGGGRDKNEFATWFRHYVYPSLPEVQAKLADMACERYSADRKKCIQTVGDVARRRIFTPGVFLSDQDVGLLCTAYGINIVSFEGQQGHQTMRINGSDLRDSNRPVYMISNASGVHFEAVRTPEGSYTIPGRLALTINLIVQENIINDSFGLMRDPSTIREGVRHYGIELPSGGDAASLKREIASQIQRAKESMRLPRAANAATNSRNDYIRKRLANPENGGMLLEAGVDKGELEKQFGEAWNDARARKLAAEGGGSRRRRRSLRPRRRHTSKGHGSRRKH